jgi:ribosomal protein L21
MENLMYAVISDRNRQYRAQQGDKLVLDRNEEAAVGSTLDLPVLLLADCLLYTSDAADDM